MSRSTTLFKQLNARHKIEALLKTITEYSFAAIVFALCSL